MINRQRLVIGSAAKSELLPVENFKRSNTLEDLLKWKNLKYKRTKGVFNGKEEISFIVLFNTNEELDDLTRLFLARFDQDCIIEQTVSGECYMLPRSGKVTSLGKLKSYAANKANEFDNYTIMGSEIYVTK